MDFKDKYLKYKSKYIQLKSYQFGGGNNPKLDLNRSDNKYVQDKIKEKSILTNSELDIEDQNNLPFLEYEKLLKDLMKTGSNYSGIKIPDNELNLNFLNTISAFPIDLREKKFDLREKKLKIVKEGNYEDGKTKYKFIGDSNYGISGTISDGSTGSSAIILKLDKVRGHDSLPRDLVLKLIPIDYDSYNNYTALSFQHISDAPTPFSILSEKRYYKYTNDYYNNIALDKNYKGSNKLANGDELHISVSDFDDFKNEMVQNIIYRHILGSECINLIKYYNYLYIDIDEVTYGGILMENVDGSLDTYIDENNETILTNDIFSNSIKSYLDEIKKLKLSKYRFNHSDLKVQNVFYKLEGDQLILKIADLDKSSITFNGIRFMNGKNISKLFDLLNDKLSPFKIDEANKYAQIGTGKTRHAGLEWEQIFLRYSFFPAPPFFDILMLFICLKIQFYDKIPEFIKYSSEKNLLNKINSFLPDAYENIKDLTSSIDSGSERFKMETDFGIIILGTIISNQIKIPLNFKDEEIDEHTQKLVELSKEHKLVLVKEDNYSVFQRDEKYGGFAVSNTWKNTNNNIIFYTGNVSPPKDKIVKTNRYTQNFVLRISLYEWDYMNKEIVEEASTAGGK